MPYFATSDHCKLYYEEYGEGQAVVLIHGWSATHHFFEKQIPLFREKYKVLCYDLRGHGDSERPEYGLYMTRLAQDLKELITFRGLKNVVLVGWSMGVHIIFEYIRNYGCDNLSKLVLIDMSARLLEDPETNWPHVHMGKCDRSDVMNSLEYIIKDWGALLEVYIPVLFGDGPCQEEIPWVISQAKRNSLHVMASLSLSMYQQDYRDMLDKITVPALITYGRCPSLYTRESSEYLKEHISQATIASFNGGHIHFRQDPEHFNQVVTEFIG